MIAALRSHWPEYLSEGLLLGAFMIAACFATVAVEHPGSPLSARLRTPVGRRTVIGILMGLTAIGLIYSPLGRRSGAHMNPGTSLTFLLLGKMNPWDTAFYAFAQFAGGLAGVAISVALLGRLLRHKAVNYVATQPGQRGTGVAWLAEFAIAFGMMGMVLLSSNHARTAPYTGVFAGLLVASYIAVEAPLSGMSMNPARTLGSAVPAGAFRTLWVYFTAPPLAMLAAAAVYTGFAGHDRVYCAKLEHPAHGACIFNCRIGEMPGWNRTASLGIQERSANAGPVR